MRRLYLDKNLQFVFCVTLMAVLGVSSIIPALPNIMTGLHITPIQIGLTLSIFTFPGIIIAPIVGISADRIGRKPILIPALCIFGIFGFACFFAKTFEQLLILRFMQGIGAGPLGVLYGTIIADLYRGNERGQAMGYNGSVLSIGTAIFPALGGLLALLGWNYPFLLPLLAIPLGLAIHIHMECPEPKKNNGLKAYFKEALAQMRTRQVLCLFATTLMTFIILYGPIVTYLPILLHTRFDANSSDIGIVFLVSSGFSALASFQLGRLLAFVGERYLLVTSGILYCCCMFLIPLTPNLWMVVPAAICFGLAQGFNIPIIMTILSGVAPMEQRGAFMAANGLLLRLSQTLAPLIMGGLYALLSFQGVYMGGLVCAVCILILALFGIQTKK